MSLLGGPKSPPQKPCFFGPLVLDFSVHWFWNFRFQVFRAVGPVSGISGSLFEPRNRSQPPLLDQSRALCFQHKCLGKMQFYPFRADGPGADFGGSPGRRLFFFDFFFVFDFRSRFFLQKKFQKKLKNKFRNRGPKIKPHIPEHTPRLGASWGALGRPKGSLGGVLGSSWDGLVASWGVSKTIVLFRYFGLLAALLFC